MSISPNEPDAPIKLVLLPAPQIYRLLTMGFIANVGFSMLSGVVLAFLFAIPLITQGMTPKEIEAQVLSVINDPWLYTFLTLSGWLGAMLGGYVSARIAQQQELLYAFMLSIINISISLLLILMGSGSENESRQPLWLVLLLMIVEVFAAVQGGRFAKKRRLTLASTLPNN